MTRRVMSLLVAVSVLSVGPSIEAQSNALPSKFVNLQVIPQSAGPDVVIGAMKNFARGLGVRCQFCHVGEEGKSLDTFDFASDAKPQKETARMMMRMAAEVNGQITKAMPNAPAQGYQVTCYTCHRGQQHPQHSPDAPKPPGH